MHHYPLTSWWKLPYLCTFLLYYGLGYVHPPLSFWAHGSLLHCHLVLILRPYKHPAATLAFLLSVSVPSSQYLFQRGPIWMEIGQSHMQLPYLCRDREMTAQNVIIDLSTQSEKSSTARLLFGMSYKLLRCLNNTSRGGLFINNLNNQLWNLLIEFPLGLGKITIRNLWLCSPVGNVCI